LSMEFLDILVAVLDIRLTENAFFWYTESGDGVNRMLNEYTKKRASELETMHFPEIDLSVPVKILWLVGMDAEEIAQYHYPGVHAHSFCEIQFVFSGMITYECDGVMRQISAGQALFLPSEFPHRFLSCSPDTIKASLAVASPIFAECQAQLFPFPQKLAELMDFVLVQSEHKDALASGIISGRILEMIFMVCQSLKANVPRQNEAEFDPRYLVARDYIENNRSRMVSCEDVAKECCLSPKQIGRIFKNQTGSSLFDYIIKERMKYAKELLHQSEGSIKEISFAMGFENECSFISFFKRHSGITPGAYRNKRN